MKLRFAAFIPIAAILLSANAELTYDYKMTVEDFRGTNAYLCSFITSEFTNATDTVALSDLEIASITNLYTSRDAWEWRGQATGKKLAISSGELSFATTTTASRASWIQSNDAFHNEEFGAKIDPPAGYVSYGFLYTVFSSKDASENKLLSNTNKLTIAQIKNMGWPQYHIVPLIRPAREFWFVDPVANTTNVIAAAGTEKEEGDDGPIGVELPKPKAKSGYEFQYWETETGASLQGKEYYNPTFTLGSASTPVIVKAKLTAKNYTVTLDKQSGIGGTASVSATYDSAMPSISIPSRTGYTFGGYYDAASGGTKYYNANGSSARIWDKTAAATLYARWAVNKYNLTFVLGEHIARGYYKVNGAQSWTTITAGTVLSVDYGTSWYAYGAAETGYVAEWASGNPHEGTKAASAETATFNAIAKTSALTFDANGGEGTMTTGKTAVYDAAMPTGIALPTKTGYSFAGFYDATSGGTKYYNAGGTSARAWDKDTTKGTTLYAQWTAKTYTVTLNKQSGSGGTASVSATYGSAMQSISIPSRKGYTFGGYYTSTGGSGTQYYNADGTSATAWAETAVTTLYAKWTANTYTVTLNQGSGSGGTASVEATYDSAMPQITVPILTGYTFAGYYTAMDGGGARYYSANGSSAKRWDKTSATTLYANWTANTYTVTLDKQDGSGGPDSVTATYNSELPTVTTPTRTGYTFGGYFTEKIGGTQYYNSAGASLRTWNNTADITLYAKWTAKTSTVTFDQQDGSGGTASVDATYGEEMPSITIPTRTGYTFDGYYTSTSGYGTQYYNGNGASMRTWDKTDTSITLYAKWTANTYTVTLDQQGGCGGTESVTATYASSMPTATMPTRDGYAFGGYYTAANGGGDQYYNANGASAQAWYLTDDTTLYAKWGEITYTLKLWPNGGTGSSVSTNLTYDEEYTLPTVATLGYTKTGYRFNGWGEASESTTALYADGATVSNLTSTAGNTVNLYAIWVERTYTVTFDANGGEIDDGDSTMECTYNSTYGSLPVPSRTGYTFTGWKNGDNSITGDMTCTLADDATFTASWTPINYVIAFDANGGTGGMDAINAVYDTEVTLPASTFESPGKLLGFAGWSESATDPETPDVEIAYADQAVVSNLVTEAGATNTLYAVWRYPDMNYALENFDLEFAIPSAYTDKVTINTEDCFVEAANGGRFTTILTNAEGTLSFNWDTTGNGYVQIWTHYSGGKAQEIIKDYTPDVSAYAIDLSMNIAVKVFWRTDSGTDKTIKVSKVKWTPAGDEPTDEDAPDISSLSVADGVKFTSDARFNYEIWYKTDLSSTSDWEYLKTIEGTGGEVGFDLIQPGEDVMFYEIKVVGK